MNVPSHEDDEAMEAASNVMETTTNSSNSSTNSTTMDDAVALGDEEKEVTMEDAASPGNDVQMQDEEGNEEMAVPSADQDEGDEPMEEKAELKEETMNTGGDDKEIVSPIPRKMSSDAPDKPEASHSAPEKPRPAKPSSFEKSLSLHDCLSLGEIELGLENQRQQSQTVPQDVAANQRRATSEIQRLPYILRLLSSTRPLASISIMDLLQNSSEKDHQNIDGQKQPADTLVDGVVDSLEDVAATYSIAEAVDVVTNHLAPSLTKKISRLKPLRHIVSNDGSVPWDTADLNDVARDPITLPAKRKRGFKTANSTGEETIGTPEQGTVLSSDDAASGDDRDECPEASVPLKKRKQANRRDSAEVAAEDSQEATFTKTLVELASLVVKSLNSNGTDNQGVPSHQNEEDDHRESRGNEPGSFALRTDDSVLTEAFRGANEGTGGAMEGSDLGSTVTAIMHHAPVLRSRQLATALCRASLDQTGDLISRLAANCPTSAPALLLGCIETYSIAIKSKNDAIANTAKECITALAKLSHNECTRVYNKLQVAGVMLDVQLRLAARLGNFQLSCLIAQHLSSLPVFQTSSSTMPKLVTPLERQHSRDSSGEIPDGENEDLDLTRSSDWSEPSLFLHLINNQRLYAEALGSFGEELSKSFGDSTQSQGKWCLKLRALALLLLTTCGEPHVVKKNHQSLVILTENFCNALRYLDLPRTSESSQMRDCAAPDNLCGRLSSCGILLIARLLENTDPDDNAAENRLSEQIFEFMKKMHMTSPYLDRTWKCIESAITTECPRGLLKCAMASLFTSMDGTLNDTYFQPILTGLGTFVKTRVNKVDTAQPRSVSSDLITRAAALLHCLNEYATRDVDQIVADTCELMRDLLVKNDGTGSYLLVCSIDVLRFIAEGTKLLDKSQQSQVPFVLPANLDETWTRVDVGVPAENVSDAESLYLLRLLYCVDFMGGNASGLFVVDPWSLPIKEALSIVGRIQSQEARCFLSAELRSSVQKYFPDSIELTCFENSTLTVAPFDKMSREQLMETLYISIRSIVNKEIADDKNKKDVNFLFTQVRARLCDADLYTTISSAFLSSPHNPTPRYSYSLLCRDPLVVLRYPLAIWSNKWLRRILLTTLRALMLAHASISIHESPSDASANELLVARDTVIARCMLAVMHGGNSDNMQICSATTSFIRWLVSSRPGIIALLVKQGLGELDVDWLVENVPETMNDAQSLLLVISENSCMAAAERLAAAEAANRIAIVHGSDFNDQEAAQMTAGALSQLVDSFYVILGPVGVPVTALLNDDSGMDMTQSSRKAAFRILKALSKVRGRRHAFRVCATNLQKLATMCKSESSLVQGSLAAKRKQFLKEVFDTASMAVGVTGGVQS
jgi:hypothetical protein